MVTACWAHLPDNWREQGMLPGPPIACPVRHHDCTCTRDWRTPDCPQHTPTHERTTP